MKHDPTVEQEWIRQLNVIYGGLIAIGIVFVQPFIGGEELDTAGLVCVIAWAIAIPLLAALVLVNYQETFRRRPTKSRIAGAARSLAQMLAFVGVVAGFWHVTWIAGVAMLAAGLVAVGVHSAGYAKVEWPDGYPWQEDNDGSDTREQ